LLRKLMKTRALDNVPLDKRVILPAVPTHDIEGSAFVATLEAGAASDCCGTRRHRSG
jgi:hypothetical protein